jgi:hypothetical protein
MIVEILRRVAVIILMSRCGERMIMDMRIGYLDKE